MLDTIQDVFQSREGPRPLDISAQDTFELLRNSRRRHVLRRTATATGSVDVGTLAEEIAAEENNIPADAVSSQERKRVYVGLIQVHLPKLDHHELLDYDEATKTTTATWRTHTASTFIESIVADHVGGARP